LLALIGIEAYRLTWFRKVCRERFPNKPDAKESNKEKDPRKAGLFRNRGRG
jgi:hypothetical protein